MTPCLTPSASQRVPRARDIAIAAAGLALCLGATLPAHAQESPALGRVISASPIYENGQAAGYSVTYDYAGRQYTTRTDEPPGRTIPVQVNAYGVTTYPVAPQPPLAVSPEPMDAPPQAYPVTPEPGVVVSGNGVPYGAAAPVYAAPAYAYPAPYVYPPIGLSFNLGYSRGWHRGWR